MASPCAPDPRPDVEITLADAPTGRMLAQRWPALATLHDPHELWVARDAGGTMRGAIAIDLYPVPMRVQGCPVMLLFDDDERAPGLCAALLHQAEATARRLGRKALYSWDSVPCDSAEQRFWESLGFEANAKLAHYQVALSAYLDLLTPMYDALTAHGRVPISARVIPLSESPVGEVIQLQMEHIGGDAGRLESRLRGKGWYPFDPDMSRVAIMDGRVCGFLLAVRDRRGGVLVESKVVAPGARRTWVNVAVMEEAAQAAKRAGIRQIRFLAGPRHEDTHRLALKAGPAGRRMAMMMRILGLPGPLSPPTTG